MSHRAAVYFVASPLHYLAARRVAPLPARGPCGSGSRPCP